MLLADTYGPVQRCYFCFLTLVLSVCKQIILSFTPFLIFQLEKITNRSLDNFLVGTEHAVCLKCIWSQTCPSFWEAFCAVFPKTVDKCCSIFIINIFLKFPFHLSNDYSLDFFFNRTSRISNPMASSQIIFHDFPVSDFIDNFGIALEHSPFWVSSSPLPSGFLFSLPSSLLGFLY